MENIGINLSEVKYHVIDVAAYCLKKNEMNCFKLQKVLYYIQAAFIVKKRRPCFIGKIVNAKFGPIIPTIENIYSIFGNQIISLNESELIGDAFLIESEDGELIDLVCKKCEVMSGNDLSIATHQDDPWSDTADNEVISCKSIFEFYTHNESRLMI